MTKFDPTTQKHLDLWLNSEIDQETKEKLLKQLREKPDDIIDAFYQRLTFGTGGLRGIMGPGTNRMNQYTVGMATQGLANYINRVKGNQKNNAVFIGYDSRHQSRFFAEEAAKVLAGNGLRVYLCTDLRPTPLISFGCRFKECQAAIMITASHNPPEYNGYKVYWEDGGQVVPPHDIGIINEVNKITDLSQIKKVNGINHEFITLVGDEIDKAYVNAIHELQCYPKENKEHGSELKIVYSSLHGTGSTMIPKTLESWGFDQIVLVDSQKEPDGNFPTVTSPNPEDPAALALGIETLKRENGDLLIATDPDTDRVGVVVNHEGEIHTLNGNQIACLCLYHLCEGLTAQGRMPERAAFVKTIATTELFKIIVESYGAHCEDVLTGFKYISQKVLEWENKSNGYQFVFGGEESYGYLLGTHCRDKDGVISCALICEVALHAKRQGKTLIDLLDVIYQKFGVYYEKLCSISFPETKEGRVQMTRGMNKLKSHPPDRIHGIDVMTIEDFNQLVKTDLKSGKTEKIFLPPSNVFRFWLTDGSKLMVRPSGTEPKIKIYCGVANFGTLEFAKNHANSLVESFKALLID